MDLLDLILLKCHNFRLNSHPERSELDTATKFIVKMAVRSRFPAEFFEYFLKIRKGILIAIFLAKITMKF